ncbi:DDB1- and CUL4-associated factor 12 [Geranomyces michiganensis]|nr:DDB1- and CUL4-associated factor 12 [Geranomyces michiganensis]
MVDKNVSLALLTAWVAGQGRERGVSLIQYLQRRETAHSPLRSDGHKQALSSFISRRLPGAYGDPTEFDLDGADKIFAAVWLNDNQVVLGTKCNRMCVLTIDTGRKVWIPLVGANDDVAPTYLDIPTPGGDALTNAQDADLVDQYPVLATVLERRRAAYTRTHGTGVRCLAINRAQTLLAVGAGKPLGDIQIYSIPTFTPTAILRGHQDMVFSLIWVNDSLLVSGARDTTVRTWDLTRFASPPSPRPPRHITDRRRSSDMFPPLPILTPTSTKREHREKVRDMQYSSATLSLATLSADGFVKVWDAQQMRVGAAIPLRYTEETCCLAMADPEKASSVSSTTPLYAVGSAYKVSVLDSRARETVLTFDSLDEGWGVRSLLFEDSVISIGGGKGRISFYDLRMPGYISWESSLLSNHNERYLTTGAGYLERDNVIDETFEGGEFRNAVYVLSRRNGRLFAAGGPLQMSLRGSYAGIW